MHPRHSHHHHGPRSPFAFLAPLVFIFLFFSLVKFAGPFLFLLIPLAFFAFKARGWSCDDDGEKAKNDEKPKRRVVETVDGELLEVIDEPRRV